MGSGASTDNNSSKEQIQKNSENEKSESSFKRDTSEKVVINSVSLFPKSPHINYIWAHYGGKNKYKEYIRSRSTMFKAVNYEFSGVSTENGQIEGEGIVKVKIGKTNVEFKGFFSKDKFTKGTIKYENGPIYDGLYRNNSAQGICRVIYPDKSEYLGDIRDDLRHGKGEYTFPDGSFYKGEFRGEYRNGYGELFLQRNKAKYRGHFYLNMKHGNGTLTWKDGTYYKGGWKMDKAHGKGVFKKANGSKFEGIYINGKKNGLGTEINIEENWKYKGMYKDDEFNGYGMFIDPESIKFEGNFDKGFKKGLFKITMNDNEVFEKNIDEEVDFAKYRKEVQINSEK